MTNGDIRVGILGLRHLHPRSYMPLFQAVQGMKVVAAAESDPELLASFACDYKIAAYADWRDLIDCEQLNLAAIFLPHAECPAAAVACAERKIHLMVEKPMAASAAGAFEMICAARRAGVILSTPYVWRFHPVSLEMRRLVTSGALGGIVGCSGRCAAGRPVRYRACGAGWMLEKALSGGGPMHNLGVHWIDLFQWMVDDEVTEVVARTLKVRVDYDVEDNSYAILTFSRGAALALDISYGIPDNYPHGRDLYLSLRGTWGVASWSPGYESLHEELLVCTEAGEYAAAGGRSIRLDLPEQEGYAGVAGLRYLQDLARAVGGERAPSVTGVDGLRALEVVESIYQSAETGQVVKVARAECS